MIVGAAAIELHVHGSQSLKQKRGVVRSIVQRTRNRFNIAVAEIGGQDTWQRVVLGLVTTGNDRRYVRGQLERALHFVEELHLAEVTGSDVELLEMCYEGAPVDDGEDAALPWASRDGDAGGGGDEE